MDLGDGILTADPGARAEVPARMIHGILVVAIPPAAEEALSVGAQDIVVLALIVPGRFPVCCVDEIELAYAPVEREHPLDVRIRLSHSVQHANIAHERAIVLRIALRALDDDATRPGPAANRSRRSDPGDVERA